MSLVTLAEVRALINTSLVDANLQVVIDRVEAEVTARIGAPQDDSGTATITKILPGEGDNLFLPGEVASIVSIVERDEGGVTYTLLETDYRVWGGGVIERLPEDSHWEDQVLVTYKPVDDRLRRTAAIIDLVRLDLSRTAMLGESVAGEYSYTAPGNWEAERKRIMKRLAFPVVG
jgi:hypothetical protein